MRDVPVKNKVNLIKKLFVVFAFAFFGCQAQIDPREQQHNWPPPDPESPLIGTRWSNPDWGGRELYFETPELVFYTRIYTDVSSYKNYLYDKEMLKGEIESLGHFTVTNNYQRIVFSNIEGFGHNMNFTKK